MNLSINWNLFKMTMLLFVFLSKITIVLILQLHSYKKVNTKSIFSIFIGIFLHSAQCIHLKNNLIYIARFKYSKDTQEKAENTFSTFLKKFKSRQLTNEKLSLSTKGT